MLISFGNASNAGLCPFWIGLSVVFASIFFFFWIADGRCPFVLRLFQRLFLVMCEHWSLSSFFLTFSYFDRFLWKPVLLVFADQLHAKHLLRYWPRPGPDLANACVLPVYACGILTPRPSHSCFCMSTFLKISPQLLPLSFAWSFYSSTHNPLPQVCEFVVTLQLLQAVPTLFPAWCPSYTKQRWTLRPVLQVSPRLGKTYTIICK